MASVSFWSLWNGEENNAVIFRLWRAQIWLCSLASVTIGQAPPLGAFGLPTVLWATSEGIAIKTICSQPICETFKVLSRGKCLLFNTSNCVDLDCWSSLTYFTQHSWVVKAILEQDFLRWILAMLFASSVTLANNFNPMLPRFLTAVQGQLQYLPQRSILKIKWINTYKRHKSVLGKNNWFY